MNRTEQEAVVAVALLAAFADGRKDENEHAAIRRVAEGFQMQLVDMAGLYQQVITGQLTLEQATQSLQSQPAKDLAYEVGRCICEADGVMLPEEQQFLDKLTQLIKSAPASAANSTTVGLDTSASDTSATGNDLVVVGSISDPAEPLDPVLVKYSVLTAALELLPQTAGALAILPVQLKMVYDISQRHGVQIDQQSVKDFGAALGIGAASQILEAGLRRLLNSVIGSVGGSLAGNMSSGVAGTAMTFATTYALGTVANQYYAAGRKIDLNALKLEFSKLVDQAKVTQSQYTHEITEKAKQLSEMLRNNDLSSILGGLVQGKF